MNRSLCFAMEAILGVEGIHDKKFTSWATRQRVINLEFDSTAEQVRMIQSKIDKARIIVAAYTPTVLTRKAYGSLLATSHDHVHSCCPSVHTTLEDTRAPFAPIPERNRVLHQPQVNGISLEHFNRPVFSLLRLDKISPYPTRTFACFSKRKNPVSTGLLVSYFHGSDMADPFEQALRGLCLSFLFLLSRSEMAINNDKFHWFAVRAQDIVVVDRTGQPTISPFQPQSVCMRLIGFKTNQNGIARQDSYRVLGIRACARYSSTCRIDKPLPVDVSTRLKRSAKKQAMTLVTSARTPCGPEFLGLWVPDGFKAYTRLCKESVTTLASAMVGGTRDDSTLH
ncbi:LOW QUALITY PROTEIN: hypothetical protein PHMEG_00010687 [Phytophthora megakarya]|uniref:Uncharacterized protein n=1 Tax=Phytophthora megakarya TaxID=4795 RepID=A0A225WDE2_9STRA|nr:LOW QUALITY PROTEIN: hypothetical protein PHMEG_00010687 [Phytophthora megakarya]